MLRWLLLPLGLAIVAAAGWLWLAEPSAGPTPAASPSEAHEPGAPMGEIDDASRAKLERVLEREGLE